MPGFPVVISANGIPVVAVGKDAPLATVASNGLGTPISVVHEGGTPLVIDSGPVPGGSIPVNVSPPTVTSFSPLVNREEDGHPGLWQSESATTYAYRWQESEDGQDWSDVDSATNPLYTPVFANRMKYLRIGVIATNENGSSEEIFSGKTALVAPLDFQIYAGYYGGLGGNTGYGKGSFGGLTSAEPIPGYDLIALYSRPEGYGNIAFSGDCSDVISGLQLSLSGSAPSEWLNPTVFSLINGETQSIVGNTSPFPMTAVTNVTWIQIE